MNVKNNKAGKKQVAISACLLGKAVRYDGRNKQHSLISNIFLRQLKKQLEVIPFCPETAIGLGVPRDKIELVRQNDESIRVLGVVDHTWDVTEALQSYADTFLKQYPNLMYFIVKSRSPSCGYNSTPVFVNGLEVAMGSGMFVQSLLHIKPDIKIINESDLLTEQDCLEFLGNIDFEC